MKINNVSFYQDCNNLYNNRNKKIQISNHDYNKVINISPSIDIDFNFDNKKNLSVKIIEKKTKNFFNIKNYDLPHELTKIKDSKTLEAFLNAVHIKVKKLSNADYKIETNVNGLGGMYRSSREARRQALMEAVEDAVDKGEININARDTKETIGQKIWRWTKKVGGFIASAFAGEWLVEGVTAIVSACTIF